MRGPYKTSIKTLDDFLARTVMTESGCREWTRGCTGEGYGHVQFDGKVHRAHRVMWFLTTGKWPDRLLHTCDNPKCVLMEHLYEGTQGRNILDACERVRRHAPLAGKVQDIRNQLFEGCRQRDLAAFYGVTQGAISYIARGLRITS